MKQNTHKNVKNQNGNIFTVLIGAVALVGVVSIASMNLLSGPVATSSRVMQKTMADSQMFSNNKIIIMDAVNGAGGGDCDTDTFIEPAAWRAPGAAAAPLNDPGTGKAGGLIPTSLGVTTVDPWGTEYGYCVWDVGTTTDAAGCGGPGALRLDGDDDPIAGANNLNTVIAIISAGKDRIFQTKCRTYAEAVAATKGVVEILGDDISQSYTYNDAASATSSIWNVAPTNAKTITVDKSIKFADETQVLNADCTAGSANSMRYNAFTNVIEVCDGAGAWNALSGGGGGGLFELDTVPTPNVVRNTGNHTLEDFVFGSPQLADDTDPNHDNRMFFDKSKGAFRAGTVIGNLWDDANVGTNSFATGSNTKASGSDSFVTGSGSTSGASSSFAAGSSVIADGNYSIAMGRFSWASGLAGMATGNGSLASGANSTAMGSGTVASGNDSFAIGRLTTAGPGTRTVAMGLKAIASGVNSFAFGLGDAVAGPNPTVSGAGSFGIFMGDQSGVDVTAANVMSVMGGNVGIGTVSPTYALHVSGFNQDMGISAYGGTVNQKPDLYFSRANGTDAAPTALTTNNYNLGGISMSTYDGAAYQTTSSIMGWLDGAGGLGDTPGRLVFSTTLDATTTPLERMRITNAGRVGIGTTGPATLLHVRSPTTSSALIQTTATGSGGILTLENTNAGGNAATLSFKVNNVVTAEIKGWDNALNIMEVGNNPINFWTNGVSRMTVDGAGNVGIGQVPAAGIELDVLGDIEYTGTLTDVSDRRLKTDIKPLGDGMLDKLAQTKSYSFRMKGDENGQIEFGVMAQDLEKIFPELVRTSDDEMGTKSVNYIGLIPPLLEGTKTLKAENAMLKQELIAVKKDIEALKAYTGYKHNKASFANGLLFALITAMLAVFGFGVWQQRFGKQG